MSQRTLLPVWLMKGLGAAITQSCTGLYSLGFVWSWCLHEEELLLSVLCNDETVFVLAVSEQKGWGWLLSHSVERKQYLSFKIQGECAEILF